MSDTDIKHELPIRRVTSVVVPEGALTEPGMDNQVGDHGEYYLDFPELKTG